MDEAGFAFTLFARFELFYLFMRLTCELRLSELVDVWIRFSSFFNFYFSFFLLTVQIRSDGSD